MSSPPLRSYTDRLADLLADARGAEVLTQMQLISHQLGGAVSDADYTTPIAQCGPTRDMAHAEQIGAWRVERDADGMVLRLNGHRSDLPWWAKEPEVRLVAGARRVVLVGESAARGWIYDPDFTPALALRRHLDAAAPGKHQVVDLAKAGAKPEELIELAEQLALITPDCIVLFAGNNWEGLPFPPDLGGLNKLATAIRDGGYPCVRDRFVDDIMLPRIHTLLDRLIAVHEQCGTEIVVVIPEFNLQGWTPPVDVELPTLAADDVAQWYRLRNEASIACAESRWTDVAPLCAQMRELDDGMSPVTGMLLARAAERLGDAAAARAGLEQARDALIGMGVLSTPRICVAFQQILTDFAREHSFPCVDLRSVLADGDLGLPARSSFLDYCHLSDTAIERTMCVVADAVLGLPTGTTAPGPGAPAGLGGIARLMSAAQNAHLGQPADVVCDYLVAALEADPEIRPLMDALLDLLESAGPVWTHSSIGTLASARSAREFLGPMLLANHLSDGVWILRDCLYELLGRTPPADAAEVNMLVTANKMDRQRIDCTAVRSFRQVTAERSAMAFPLQHLRAGTVHLSYRMPAGPRGTAATVSVNEVPVGTLPVSTSWTGAEVSVPREATRAGVNWVQVRWPVPATDADRWHDADAAALARGQFPTVVPVFGELFEARFVPDADETPA